VQNLNRKSLSISPTLSRDEVEQCRYTSGFPPDSELLTPAQRKVLDSSEKLLNEAIQATRDARHKIANSHSSGAEKNAEYDRVTAYEHGGLQRIKDSHTHLVERPRLQELLNEQLLLMASLLDCSTEVILPEQAPKLKKRRCYRIADSSLRDQLLKQLKFIDQCADALEKLPQNEIALYHTHVFHPNKQTTYDRFREQALIIRQKLYVDEVPPPTPLTGQQNVYKLGPSVQGASVIPLGRYTPSTLEHLLEQILSLCEKSNEQLQTARELLPAIDNLRTDLSSRITELHMRKETAKSDSTKRTPNGKQAKKIINKQIILELVIFHWKYTGQLQGVTHVAADKVLGLPSVCKCPLLDFIRVMYAKFPDFEAPKDRTLERHINRAVGLVRDGNAAL